MKYSVIFKNEKIKRTVFAPIVPLYSRRNVMAPRCGWWIVLKASAQSGASLVTLSIARTSPLWTQRAICGALSGNYSFNDIIKLVKNIVIRSHEKKDEHNNHIIKIALPCGSIQSYNRMKIIIKHSPAGDGKSATIASRSGCTPRFFNALPQSTGKQNGTAVSSSIPRSSLPGS